MSATTEGRFPACMAQIDAAIALVEEHCQRGGVGRDDMLRLTLVVEELFTNTVEHGLAGGGEGEVVLHLSPLDDGVALRYEDDAPPFDPLSAPPPDALGVGGQGIALVKSLARSARYAREEGRNRLWIELACRG